MLAFKAGIPGLPASLQELEVEYLPESSGASLASLARLQVLRASFTHLNAAMLASLPPSLLELHAAYCNKLALGASFAHLPALHTLDASYSDIDDASLASMPPSLVSLNVRECKNLTPAAVLPHLPSLQRLDVSYTGVGDALVASLPAGVRDLRLVGCCGVTASATLHHVRALQALLSYGTDLAPSVLAACRARGCVVPVAGLLRGHRQSVGALAFLADGRLVSGDKSGEVRVWDTAGEGKGIALLRAGSGVTALVALRDGHRLAAGVEGRVVEVWEVGVAPSVRTATIICPGSYRESGYVRTLAVLRDGRLAAGTDHIEILIIDVDARAAVATLNGHMGEVSALAVLPGGALVSGSGDRTVQVRNVGTRAYIATLMGHGGIIRALEVLPDGRLASGSDDGTVRLWNVGARTCVGVLTGHTDVVRALAVLPDGRLASASEDGSVRVWDTRPIAAAGASCAASTAPMVTVAHGLSDRTALLPLPDGRLACAGAREGAVYLLDIPPTGAVRGAWLPLGHQPAPRRRQLLRHVFTGCCP